MFLFTAMPQLGLSLFSAGQRASGASAGQGIAEPSGAWQGHRGSTTGPSSGSERGYRRGVLLSPALNGVSRDVQVRGDPSPALNGAPGTFRRAESLPRR